MLINLSPINFQYNKNIQKPHTVKPNPEPLTYDTVSFGAMKKKEFEGIDLAVVQKFKAPIEKFNSNIDLQNWAKEKDFAHISVGDGKILNKCKYVILNLLQKLPD